MEFKKGMRVLLPVRERFADRYIRGSPKKMRLLIV